MAHRFDKGALFHFCLKLTMITLLPVILDLSQYLVRCIDSGLPSDTTSYANFGCQLGKPDCAYGLKQSLAADALAFHTCMDISIHAQDNFLTSGISYDMRKCFDTIPMILVLQIFNFRGADSQVTRALNGFYKQHHKYFKLEGSFDTPFRPSNGIIQGCPLSMLLLTSMVSAWCEFCMVQLPQSQPRSYADDLSVCNFANHCARNLSIVLSNHINTQPILYSTPACSSMLRNVLHSVIAVLEDSLPQITTHKSQFRLVGASVKLDSKKGWTDLEKERRTRWQQTVRNVGLLIYYPPDGLPK